MRTVIETNRPNKKQKQVKKTPKSTFFKSSLWAWQNPLATNWKRQTDLPMSLTTSAWDLSLMSPSEKAANRPRKMTNIFWRQIVLKSQRYIFLSKMHFYRIIKVSQVKLKWDEFFVLRYFSQIFALETAWTISTSIYLTDISMFVDWA